MDTKVIVYVAATAITLATGMIDAHAAGAQSLSNVATPTIVTVSPAATGDYIVSSFTFARSPNVGMQYDVGVNVTAAGDTGIVTTTNATKGNRTFAGAVGALNSTARACQNTGTTVIATAPAPTSAIAAACTF